MATKQNKTSRNSAIHIDGNVSGSTIHIGDTLKTGYTPEEVSVLITQIQSTFQPSPFDGRCPYKGLDVFNEEDAEFFFGREKLVDDLVSRVKESRTVFVTGPSGSGKSSLVRAGLIHTLKQGAIKGSERWLYATMKPGRDPLESLATAFSRLKSPELGKYFLQNADQITALHECAESTLTDNKNQRLALFIDQFEEVFTQISQEEERVAFLNLLTHAATVENGRVIILFSMRSDFVSNCATYPQLNAILNQQFVQIGAMQPEELVSAIAQPALRVGLRMDPDLIAQIINEMKGEPGALPLMQFALKDLFDSQGEKSGVVALTLNDYLQRGGIHKALERHADDSFSKLSKNEQELARSIFSGLIEIGRGTQDTKRTALFDELIPVNTKAEDVEVIVQKLADARLITTDEQASKETVTISHEKLIDAWPWLKKLVNENRDVITLQNQISTDAKEWQERKRDASYLYTGGRLANVREQLERRKLSLGNVAQEFVHEGQARQRHVQAFQISAVSVVLITAIVASVVFRNQAEEAKKLTNIALVRQLASQAQFIYSTNGYNDLANLLFIQSLKLAPSAEVANYLLQGPADFINVDKTISYGMEAVAFSPNGKFVVSGSADGTVLVWSAITGYEMTRISHGEYVTSVAISPDSKYVVSGGSNGVIRVWAMPTGNEVAHMNHGNVVIPTPLLPTGVIVQESVPKVTSVKFSPDGKFLVSGSGDGTARVWEVLTGKEVSRMTHEDGVAPSSIIFSREVLCVDFSPDGKFIVSGSRDGTARVWEVSTGEEVSRMIHSGFVISVTFSPAGKYVASGGDDGTVRVWELTSGREVANMIHDSGVTSIDFSPDGKYVVSGSYDGSARVWDVKNGMEIARTTQNDGVLSVAFSPDGNYVASGGWDGTVRVWETLTGKEVIRVLHQGKIIFADFRPDGKFILSVSFDGSARVWMWQESDLISNACREVGRNLTRAEWNQYIGDVLPYQAVCPNFPIEVDTALTPTATP